MRLRSRWTISLGLFVTSLLAISIAFATRPQAASSQSKTSPVNQDSESSTAIKFAAKKNSSRPTTPISETDDPVLKTDGPNQQVTNGKIFFNSDRDGNSEIYVMNSDGTGQTRLTNNPAVDADPVWSAAAQKLAFVSNRNGWFQIYTMNADGSGLLQLTTITANEASPTWSPNGTQIAFASARSGNVDIYTMNADGSAQSRVTFHNADDLNPSWSPDGNTIAFEANRDGNYEIFTVSRFGGAGTRVANKHLGSDRFSAWSSDGTKILFASTRDGNQEIYLMNSDGTNAVRVTNNAATDALPAWSPDGSRIAFESNRDGNFQLYSMNADGSNQTRLTVNPFTDGNATWSDSPLFPPINDNFANAQTISGCTGSMSGTNTAATKEAGEPNHSPDGSTTSRSIWYRWTAPVSSSVTITTSGSSIDTVLGVYTGDAVNALTPIAKGDDTGNSLHSSVTFTAVADTVYQIAVDGYGDAAGQITLNWTQASCPTPSPSPSPTATHTISGRVLVGGNVIFATLTLSGSQNATTSVNASGDYTFSNLPAGGNYTVTPSAPNYSFTPASLSFNNLGANQNSANFNGTRTGFSILARVYRPGPVAVAKVPVTLSGSSSASGFTNAGGLISFDNLVPGGNYTVIAGPQVGFTISPYSHTFTNLMSDQQADFQRTPIYRVSGRVTDNRGNGVGNVGMVLGVHTDPVPTGPLTTTTDSSGNFSFGDFSPAEIQYAFNQFFVVYPSKQGYSFSPVLYRSVAGIDVAGISIGTFQADQTKTVVANFTAQRQPAATAWISTGVMNVPRDQHSATLLANGRVLVAGGHNQTAFVSAAELYDPASGTWAPTGSMAGPRQYHTATLLPNGKVLVAGNNISQGVSASAELYDPVSGQWLTAASMNAARSVHTANLLPNGKVLVAGGISSLGRYLNSAELYDPATGTWTPTGFLSAARYGHTATLLPNGKVLLTGGFDAGQVRNGAELYDPATGTWTVTGSFTTGRFLHTATLLANGKVLIAGGRINSQAVTTNAAELYDPSSGTWTVTGTLNTSRDQHTATLLSDGTVIVAGGGAGTSSAELYDPSTGIWSPIVSMLAARSVHTATLLLNEKVLVAGGINNTGGGTLASAELYDSTPGWEPTALATSQVEIKSWTYQGRTYVYVKALYPNAGYRVTNWGQVINSAGNFSADATVEKFSGASIQALTTTAQIYDLGPLADGNYTFNFSTSGTLVKSQGFSVSSAIPPPNPIDNAREFVRQQYLDFLNRQADQAGEDFWTDNITKCADPARRPAGQTEAQCTLRQRETTSAAFFLSPEFQYTGYFVYRMYQGALGRQPKLSEFTPDMQTVANGILVNGQLSAAKINQNKAAFAASFVSCVDGAKPRCAEFKAIYDGLNNDAYVDKLFQTTGIVPDSSQRNALVAGLNGQTETRASVLQKIVDGIVVIAEGNQQFTTTYGQAFYNAELNRAFVQLEYFGYLKRDPDEAGYAFWLGKLNQFNGDYLAAEMVLAFITSPEYRSRFGQP